MFDKFIHWSSKNNIFLDEVENGFIFIAGKSVPIDQHTPGRPNWDLEQKKESRHIFVSEHICISNQIAGRIAYFIKRISLNFSWPCWLLAGWLPPRPENINIPAPDAAPPPVVLVAFTGRGMENIPNCSSE